MTQDQIILIAILLATMAMFIWGRWRHDMVAAGSLLACVVAGLVPSPEAFAGFGHPAVITVASVLILSRGLQITGAVDAMAQKVLPTSYGPTVTIAALTGLAALLSGFMNNVGALALLMPVAIQIADDHKLPHGKVLMPLAFGSILGGTMTMIGTPPNLIVSGFRAEAGLGNFMMFDFTPVGMAVAAAGVSFIALIGWRLIPSRKEAGIESFDTGAYFTEVRVTEKSKAIGKTLREVERIVEDEDAQVLGMVRQGFRTSAPNPHRIVRADDILVIEAEPESLSSVLSSLGLKLEEDVPTSTDGEVHPPVRNGGRKGRESGSDDVALMEYVVMPASIIAGRSASQLQLRTHYGLNLLAISRQGRRSIRRLRTTAIEAGDVLLMQGTPEALSGFAAEFGCAPLKSRSIHIPNKRRALVALVTMTAAVAAAAFGVLPVAVSFAAAVLAFMSARVVSPRSVYEAIDWPVIILLGAMLPVAGAMASTGAADWIARFFLDNVARADPAAALAVILVATMLMTDFMNNAATAAVMSPIGISAASHLGVSPDPFLMAVAIGASCAFLTPIGHQNNTLILGPGGFRFGDYWRMGLPVDILVLAVALPMIMLVWPF
jgi:di/tricarboxylate transporter